LPAARRSAEGGAGGAEFAVGADLLAGTANFAAGAADFADGAADFADGAADVAAGGADLALGKSDLIGKAPPLPNLIASSSAAACKSSRHGSFPCAALQRARAKR